MKTVQVIRILSVTFFLCLLPSCTLIGSILKIPVGILKTVGRTAGVSSLTDNAPQPVEREAAGKSDEPVKAAEGVEQVPSE
jgi:hypothetical protein